MNIYDIAKLSGVSIATVSRVVNGSSRVSERTKQKVLKVMEDNDYTPNIFARGLGLDSMQTIGIVCPDVADVFVASVVSYLERDLKNYGYDCILYCSGYSNEKKKKSVETIRQKRIDALILVGSTYIGDGNTEEHVEYIKKAAEEVPVFLINGRIAGENIYSVYCADREATYTAASEMVEAGYEKILFLSDSHSYSANQKLEGYEQALRDHGIPVLGQRKLYMKNQVDTVRDILLARRDLDFDAVLATDDGLAVGAVKYANARKLDIPKEINIVGYNNSELALCCGPELSSIDNFPEKMSSRTIVNMMKVLRGKKEEAQADVEIPCTLVKRCTTCF